MLIFVVFFNLMEKNKIKNAQLKYYLFVYLLNFITFLQCPEYGTMLLVVRVKACKIQ